MAAHGSSNGDGPFDPNSNDTKRPSVLRWVVTIGAFVTILSGIYEVLPVLEADHLSGTPLQLFIHVILLTKVFKVMLALMVTFTGASLYNISISIISAYMSEPLSLLEHAIVIGLLVAVILMGISVVSNIINKTKLLDYSKDATLLIGTTIFFNCISLLTGVSLGGAKQKKETTALEERLRETHGKLVALHAFVLGIKDAPPIPPECKP